MRYCGIPYIRTHGDQLHHVVYNPQCRSECLTDTSAALGSWNLLEYHSSSKNQQLTLPELVSPKICGFPTAAAAEISAAYGEIWEAIALWLIKADRL